LPGAAEVWGTVFGYWWSWNWNTGINLPWYLPLFNLRLHKALVVGYLLVGIVVIELRILIE